jgi:hypothetical protein
MRAKKVFENINFERGKEIKSSLSIGKRTKIIEWFEKYAPESDYTIDENLNIIVKGDLDCSNNNLTSIPDNLSVGVKLYCDGEGLIYEI